jgi:hypothetical protein
MTLSWYWLPLAMVAGLFLQSVVARLRERGVQVPRSGTRESSDPVQSPPALPLDELLRQLQEHRVRLANEQQQITTFLQPPNHLTTQPPNHPTT